MLPEDNYLNKITTNINLIYPRNNNNEYNSES
jgi:hypothetical protein